MPEVVEGRPLGSTVRAELAAVAPLKPVLGLAARDRACLPCVHRDVEGRPRTT